MRKPVVHCNSPMPMTRCMTIAVCKPPVPLACKMPSERPVESDGISVCSSQDDCVVVEDPAGAAVDVAMEVSSDEETESPPQVFHRSASDWPSDATASETVQPIDDDFLFDLVILGCPLVLIPLLRLVAKSVEACGASMCDCVSCVMSGRV